MSEESSYRLEKDLLGSLQIPLEAYYGIQTQRACDNFQLTGISLAHYPNLIKALAMVKQSCALANQTLGLLNKEKADAIVAACQELQVGLLQDQFQVDMIQGGAGTSTNMNANEVIANRALQLLGYNPGDYQYLHPNDDVNRSQSTNDVYPSAVRLAVLLNSVPVLDELDALAASLSRKGMAFSGVMKMGRTQLQDAVPMSLGQEFDAYAVTLREDIDRFKELSRLLLEVNLGGTAIGTGINAHPEFGALAVRYLAEISQYPFSLASNLIEASSDMGVFVLFSALTKRLAIKLSKISHDLRLLSSGPRAGLHEINLPGLQPGSSIMPGKVNPVVPEAVNQVAYQIIGNDLSISMAAEAGQLQLNVMEPLIAFKLLQSTELLARAMSMLRLKCIDGITANETVCANYVRDSIGIVTALNPYLGYETTSRIAKKALVTGQGVIELVLEEALMGEGELKEIFRAWR